jgi:hypothetical protein
VALRAVGAAAPALDGIELVRFVLFDDRTLRAFARALAAE